MPCLFFLCFALAVVTGRSAQNSYALIFFAFEEKLVVFLKEPKPRLSLVEKGLTASERTYVLAILAGQAPKEIAAEFEVAESTVRNTISHAYKKLDVVDMIALTNLAAKSDIVA
jgi:DNA-binding CsgD family transcriptional regulator